MRRKFVSALLTVLVLAAAGTAAGAPTAQSYNQSNATNVTEASAGFADDVYEISTGGVAAVALDLGDRTEAVLKVGEEDEGYVLTANVTDSDDDGRVVVLFHSGVAGANGTTVTTADTADEVVAESETDLSDPPLDAGSYSLSLRNATGEEFDVASLVVQSESVDGSFPVAVAEGRQNDTVSIPVSLDGTDTATVRIGGEQVNYYLDVWVVDRDGDGAVTLQFDTATAGTDAPSVQTNDSESFAVVRSEFSPSDGVPPLAVGSYPLSLYLGNSTADDSELAVGTMTLREPDPETTETSGEAAETTTGPAETTEKPMRSTTTSGTGDVPGFGPVLALVALAAAALLAGRR